VGIRNNIMSNLLKSKIFLGLMIVVFAFAGFASFSKAATVDCSTYQFTQTLKLKSTGDAVTCLQTRLGLASPTGYFGTKTKGLVVAYQKANGISQTGTVGQKTREALNAAPVPTPTPTPTPSEALCPNGMTLASNCTTAPSVTPTEGLCPNGNTLASNCATAPGTVISSTGEGSITFDYNPIPANNTVVKKGQNDQAGVAFKLKATGSDMKVNRLWLDVNQRLWLYASNAKLMDGSTVVKTVPLTASAFTEVTTGSLWQLQFNGLNVVVPVGATKVLTINFDRPELTSASGTVTVQTTTSIRAVDGANLSNPYTPGATRGINFQAATASVGTLTASLNANSPIDMSIAGLSSTAGVLTPVKLMDFDLKAQDGAINATAITATLAATSGTLADEVASIELRDASGTVLSSVSGGSPVTFSDLSIDIAQDATSTLSIWAQMNPVIGATTGSGLTTKGAGINAVVTGVTATSGPSFTSASISPTVTGYKMYMYKYAPTIKLETSLLAATQADESTSTTVYKSGNYTLAFTVTAPTGSDIYVDTAGTIAQVASGATTAGFSKTTDSFGGTLATTATVSGTSSVTSSGYEKVIAGTSRTWTVNGYIPHGTAAGYVGMHVNGIKWTDTDNTTTPTPVQQTWGLTDFKTATVRVTL